MTLLIKENEKTPFIKLQSDGKFTITGKSIPEKADKFYDPVLDWISGYAKNPAPETYLWIKLDYFNTSSSKYLLALFQGIAKLPSSKIFWIYEDDDEDMFEAGEDYKSLLKSDFVLINQ